MNKHFLRKNDINTNTVEKILNRQEANFEKIENEVKSIIEKVKKKGDRALKYYTKKFDNLILENIKVSKEEIDEAYLSIEEEVLDIFKEAKLNITQFHREQVQDSWMKNFKAGVSLGQKITPIERVGLYVPGGKGGYPSTVLMNAIPALLAGVESIAIITPPNEYGKVNPYILAAAKIVGIEEIYKIGGAHGIAALAYGTETIKPVNKIVGPGNIYVATAKKQVFGKVDIDMIAGPSEICIIADSDANPKFIAADMISQAEHDEMATSILITTEESLIEKTIAQLNLQIDMLPRKDIIKKSIENNGKFFVVESLEHAVLLSDIIAPEHLEIMTKNPEQLLTKINNAGAVFLGQYSPEPIGDYFAGPNHTLPTSGTAKFSSPLGVYDFVKRINIISYDKSSLELVKTKISTFAEVEGFYGHANAINIRFNKGVF